MIRQVVLFACFLFGAFRLEASAPADSTAVNSIAGIVGETLRLISGDKGMERDWDAFRKLFLPGAGFTVVQHKGDGINSIKTLSVEEFIKIAGRGYLEHGFLEYETGKVVNEYNGTATVFQAYIAKQKDHEESGINSYQLVFDGKRWWIAGITWTNDSNGVKVPVLNR